MDVTTTTEFKIKSAVFEGPLELLLQLIEARKLHINDISLASVTDDYLSHMRNLPNQELGNVTGFLAIASTLILIKSKSLLPNLTLTHDEQTDINTLEDRLRLYQVVREAVEPLSKIYGLQVIFPAPERDFTSPVFSPDVSLTKDNMLLSIANVVNALPKPEVVRPEVEIEKMMSIDEAISNLTERLSRATELSFRTLTDSAGKTPAEAKVFVIVSFLAMLELVRQGLLDVMQSNEFGDIQFIKSEETITTDPN